MKLGNKIEKLQRGFTLIELVVVIAVIAVISGTSVANFRQTERQKRLSIAVDTITNAVRTAQNYTLAGKEINDPANPSCRRPVSYTIRITEAGAVTLLGTTTCATVTIESYPLPQNTRVQSGGLRINGVSSGYTQLDVKFTAPFALITAGANGANPTSFTEVNVVVESTQATLSDIVLIDGVSGRIGE